MKFKNRLNYLYNLGLTYSHANYYSHLKSWPTFPTRPIKLKSYDNCARHTNFNRGVPRSADEAKDLIFAKPNSPPGSKLLKIAIIGRPSSGKSTLVNAILEWEVCSVSKRPHTTQQNAQAVINYGKTQLVFLDTPGLVTPDEAKRFCLEDSLVVHPEISLQQADLLAVIHDVKLKYEKNFIHPRIMRLLLLFQHVPSILILNKIDLYSKNRTNLLQLAKTLTNGVVGGNEIKLVPYKRETDEELWKRHLKEFKEEEEAIREMSSQVTSPDEALDGKFTLNEKRIQQLIEGKVGWSKFSEVFPISALSKEGIDKLTQYFLSSAKEAAWIFNENVVTDVSPQQLAINVVREKCLELLKRNIPYEMSFEISNWNVIEAEVMNIMVDVIAPKKLYLKYAIGPSGKFVRQLASEAEQKLRNIFRTEVRLRLNMVVEKTNAPNLRRSIIHR